MNDKLDRQLIAANLAKDNISLIALYQHAAEICEAKGAVDETCFFPDPSLRICVAGRLVAISSAKRKTRRLRARSISG